MQMHRLFRRLKIPALVVPFFFLSILPAAAFDTFFAGPRAMGMGGANVASVSDTTAQYYNPAAFGFFGCHNPDGSRLACDNNNVGRKSWGIDINGAFGYRLHNQFGSYLDKLGNIDPGQLSQGVASESDLADLIKLVSSLEGIADSGNAVTADATAGLGIRVGHFAIGARGYLQTTGLVDGLDQTNLGFDIPAAQLGNEIVAVNMDAAYNSAGYQYQVFTTDQVNQLVSALGGATDPNAVEAVKRLDFIAAREGINPENVAGAVDLLNSAIQNSGTATTLDQNTTTVLLKGFGLAEVPLSYGYAINDHLAIGANLKLMRGRVYGNRIVVFDDNADKILKETDEKYQETRTFGLDLGIMARFRYINLGIVGRNLNSPKFDGFTDTIILANGQTVALDVEDVKLKPQAAVGVAFNPVPTLTLEADYDLTSNETTFSGYDTRNLSFGLEWDAFRFLALRGGAYKNLAEDDIGWVYTAGLGLNLWAVRLDVAGAFSGDKEEFDGDNIPQETRVAAQMSVDF